MSTEQTIEQTIDYTKHTKKQLVVLCKAKHIRNCNKKTRTELIELLNKPISKLQVDYDTEINCELKSKDFIKKFYEILELYLTDGSRNQKKSNCFHEFIKLEIEKYIVCKQLGNYKVILEQDIVSVNASGKKRCDIVVYKNDKPHVVLEVKLAMSSYNKNKNNYWETQTGELSHLRWVNPDIHIIPINILLSKIPNLYNKKQIKNFDIIDFDTIKIYDKLVEYHIVDKFINYILDVEHVNNQGDKYDKCPKILGFNKSTPFVPLFNILQTVIM